jgi:hypothetical protein
MSVAALPGAYKTNHEKLNSYAWCGPSVTSNCISIRVISAKGFEIAIE